MNKILILLVASCFTLYAGTLKILNIPINSAIIIDGKTYENKLDRITSITLKNSVFGSYDVVVKNKDFLPYKFSVKISDKENSIVTLEMQYSKEFLTNVFVEDIFGKLDPCSTFTCSVSSGEALAKNLFLYKENETKTNVDFTVKGSGYYNETDSYDIHKNQKVIISPVSSWGLIGFGLVGGMYPADEDFILSDGDKSIKYFLDDTLIYGGKLSYKKNTIINIFLGIEFNYMTSKEEQDEKDENPNDGRTFNGIPSVTLMSLGGSVGYRYRRFMIEAGARQEEILIEKTYTDTTYEFTESRITPYVSINYIFWAFGKGGMSLGLTSTSDKVTTASLLVQF